jgi:hypothetical protein
MGATNDRSSYQTGHASSTYPIVTKPLAISKSGKNLKALLLRPGQLLIKVVYFMWPHFELISLPALCQNKRSSGDVLLKGLAKESSNSGQLSVIVISYQGQLRLITDNWPSTTDNCF